MGNIAAPYPEILVLIIVVARPRADPTSAPEDAVGLANGTLVEAPLQGEIVPAAPLWPVCHQSRLCSISFPARCQVGMG